MGSGIAVGVPTIGASVGGNVASTARAGVGTRVGGIVTPIGTGVADGFGTVADAPNGPVIRSASAARARQPKAMRTRDPSRGVGMAMAGDARPA
jgi:hypothetical protein